MERRIEELKCLCACKLQIIIVSAQCFTQWEDENMKYQITAYLFLADS